MNSSVTGLKVRFFNVKIATGRAFASVPKSIGRTFTTTRLALKIGTAEAATMLRPIVFLFFFRTVLLPFLVQVSRQFDKTICVFFRRKLKRMRVCHQCK